MWGGMLSHSMVTVRQHGIGVVVVAVVFNLVVVEVFRIVVVVVSWVVVMVVFNVVVVIVVVEVFKLVAMVFVTGFEVEIIESVLKVLILPLAEKDLLTLAGGEV